MPLPIRGAALKSAFARVRAWMELGDSPELCAERLGLTWEQWEEFKGRFYDEHVAIMRARSTEEVYLDYIIEQRRNILQLDEIYDQASVKSAKLTAAVSAVRAKAEILDKIIHRGQEFGIIDKKPDRTVVEGSITHRLSDSQLRAAIEKELAGIYELVEQHGQIDNSHTIIDIDPGPTHRPLEAFKALPEPKPVERMELPAEPVKGKPTNKVYGGRKTIR